jgi:predicted esterase
MPLSKEETVISSENTATPILICHGDQDQGVGSKTGAAVEAYKFISAAIDLFD